MRLIVACQFLFITVAALFIIVIAHALISFVSRTASKRRNDRRSSWPTWLLVIIMFLYLPLYFGTSRIFWWPNHFLLFFDLITFMILVRWVIALILKERGVGWFVYIALILLLPWIYSIIQTIAFSMHVPAD